jgi:peptidoglycan/LPS O-acetylase OafA/YrhL
MNRFAAIEGLRGWLAWIVVFGHIAHVSDLKVVHVAEYAVLVFIVISGFVITHLILGRREPYGIYIYRRFMRIFPLFIVTCVIGYFTTPLFVEATWFWAHAETVRQQSVNFWPHAIAHLSMLHGAISSNVLPWSSLMFNSPAWSLSLEWQFYLVAPFCLLAIRKTSWAVLGLFVTIALALLGSHFGGNQFGRFEVRSLLLLAGPLFAAGIAARVILRSRRLPRTGALFEGRIATFMGARSYSIYLAHMPVVGVTLFALTFITDWQSHYAMFMALVCTVPILTLAVSCVLYELIEKPGIALGRRIKAPSDFSAPSPLVRIAARDATVPGQVDPLLPSSAPIGAVDAGQRHA